MVDKKKNIDKNHLCYELIEDNEKNQYILLRYALLFRRFDKVDEIIEKLENKNIDIEVEFKKKIQNYNVSMFDILSWNQGYFNSYIKKNGLKSKYLNKINTLNEDLFTYDDFIDLKNKETVFTLFFKFKNLPESVQNILRKKNDNIKNIDDKVIPPILDVEYYEKQLIASKQVKKNGCSLVMDEVGTGKTVTALYAIRDVIEEANLKGEKAKILIVAPSNKKEDWKSDISRQLGRYAHIVKQKDDGDIYAEDLKKIYFKQNEHYIFICGQNKGNDENGSNSELKGTLNNWCKESKWDLIVIDEGHQNFNNYENLKSSKIMILTATPIVIKSENAIPKITVDFDSYRNRMFEIINYKDDLDLEKLNINPIEIKNPTKENIFVNWFREDFDKKSATRKISFEECERDFERMDYLSAMRSINTTCIEVQHCDQDDDYMLEKVDSIIKNKEIYGKEIAYKLEEIKNKKEKRKKIIREYIEITKEKDRVIRFEDVEERNKKLKGLFYREKELFEQIREFIKIEGGEEILVAIEEVLESINREVGWFEYYDINKIREVNKNTNKMLKGFILEKNKKIEILIDILSKEENKTKSYIIFCCHKYVVKNIYNKLNNTNISNTIIGYKCGEEEEINRDIEISNGGLISTLIQNIRDNKRVILIITGKSGGLGINLGDFEGVIHYELPYTSTQLEQRFGRVDRINNKTLEEYEEKDMIFMINKSVEGYNDIEVNRMLNYCLTKIDETVKYIPIRNTILYHPDGIKRQKEKYINALNDYKEKLKVIKELKEDIKNLANTEKDSKLNYIERERKLKEKEEKIRQIKMFNISYKKTIKIIDSWLKIIGEKEINNKDENLFTYYEEQNSEEEIDKKEIKSLELESMEYEPEKEKNISKIDEITAYLEALNDINDIKKLEVNGIFLFDYEYKKIKQMQVKEFRRLIVKRN